MSMGIVEQLRKTARKSGITQYRIAKDSGLPVAVVQVWWHGGGLRCDTADRIAAALGCRIVLESTEGGSVDTNAKNLRKQCVNVNSKGR